MSALIGKSHTTEAQKKCGKLGQQTEHDACLLAVAQGVSNDKPSLHNRDPYPNRVGVSVFLSRALLRYTELERG